MITDLVKALPRECLLGDFAVTWETLRVWFEACKQAGHTPAFQIIQDRYTFSNWDDFWPTTLPHSPQFWAFVDGELLAAGWMRIPLPEGIEPTQQENEEEDGEGGDDGDGEWSWEDEEW